MRTAVTLQVFFDALDDEDAWDQALSVRSRLVESLPMSAVVRLSVNGSPAPPALRGHKAEQHAAPAASTREGHQR